MTRVGIIDYGMGNLTSVHNAFAAIGAAVEVLQQPELIASVSHLVLPGVGAFGDGMKNLSERGWIPAMEQFALAQKKPFLGICLGQQLLARRGTEHGDFAGLGWIPGEVVRFSGLDPSLRVPHIGWNDAIPAHRHSMYREGFDQPGVFYFVHSYHLVPDDPSVVDGWCEYGIRFAASISAGNIWAVQYHPEKSQTAGLQVLRNFLAAD
ncbi:MAG TPA: imidazole glycerol phosphate synthase subunit HisH [Kiritimatiellia bacterium]|nr:imidazole glycerol phosphate synthase subunit HisH [Kiritimatiellia bacterium]HMP34407.1 imidazole glycerol phosphate synthase subunit HisH [Kiritimatiellia bacterium]